MSGQLHEISQAIGRLEAAAEEHQRQNLTLFRKLDELHNQVADLAPVVETVKAIKPEVEDWTRTKNKALGVLAVLSAVMGAAGSWIVEHLGRLIK